MARKSKGFQDLLTVQTSLSSMFKSTRGGHLKWWRVILEILHFLFHCISFKGASIYFGTVGQGV